MSRTLLHDWECSIERNKNNTEELLRIAEDIYNTAYTRGKASAEVFISAGDFNVYEEGYKQGRKDFERPQGKWAKIGEVGIAYTCNKCNELNIRPTNFCPYCGAAMQKGGAE